jgi:hypothetical protein
MLPRLLFGYVFSLKCCPSSAAPFPSLERGAGANVGIIFAWKEADGQDLMQSTVGPVKNVQMAYNAQGKSTGVATVVFKNRGDGNKAHGACKLSTLLQQNEKELTSETTTG